MEDHCNTGGIGIYPGGTCEYKPDEVYDASEYYNRNYDPCYPQYPWPVITTKLVVNGCPSELWPLLNELTEVKNLLKQILEKLS